MTIPYSSPQPLPLGGLLDVDINDQTLTNGQVISYDVTTSTWKNSAGGGGGGASILGTDEAVVFKDGVNGNTFTNGITRNVTLPNYTMNLDTANKFVGINKINPAAALDVDGTALFSTGTDTLKIESDTIGLSAGLLSLKLYSNNTTASDAITEINSSDKSVGASSLASFGVNIPDAPNGVDTGAFYKIRLQLGFNLQTPGHPLWSEQFPFDPTQTNFPTQQSVEYYNTLPLDFKRIIARTASGISVTPATIYIISLFGTTAAFQDRCFYDPCMMRTRKSGVGWTWAGAPTQYRDGDIKAMLKVRWYFEGRWQGSNPQNRLDMYVNQYRSGVLFRNYLVSVSNNADACFMSGERNFMGFANYGEDINWGTDDFQVEVANQGIDDVTVDLAQVEMEFILAQ